MFIRRWLLNAGKLRTSSGLLYLYYAGRLRETRSLKLAFKRLFYDVFKVRLSPGILALSYLKPHEDDDDERKADSKLDLHVTDLEEIRLLIDRTLTCGHCGARHLVDAPVEGIVYCSCDKGFKRGVYGAAFEGVPWTPFLERPGVIVWRREEPSSPGLYAYKMYGKFEDVSPREFLDVQLDLSEFRLAWDKSTAQCHAIQGPPNDESQYYYWEVKWPSLFANRDYVCRREVRVDEERRVIVVFTEADSRVSYPKKESNFRVEDYYSAMTVKPLRENQSLDEKGLEFSLTAFENPGVSLPSSITTWVAIRGMPEFMINLRAACLEKRNWKKPSAGCKSSNDFLSSNESSSNAYA